MVDLPDEAREMKDKGQNVEGDMFDRKKPDNQQGQTDEDMSRENQQE